MEQKQYLRILYTKLIDRTISEEELSWLQQYFERSELESLHAMIRSELELSDEEGVPATTKLEIARGKRVYNHLEQEIGKEIVSTPRVRLWPRIAAAASIILAIGAGVLFYTNRPATDTVQTDAHVNDIAPGKQGATLILANGKKIRLSDVANGQLAREAGVNISKTADGQVIYEVKALPDGVAENNLGAINTLTTAKGETYILTLPDKSKVWLNAASSLTYTAALTERRQRRVKLSGEAYFEITKDKEHPFIVETDGQEVEVLGTHFNINAYKNEPVIKTTLMEGSVKVSNQIVQRTLKPGEQARNTGTAIGITKVDTEAVIDWKKGQFVFNDEPLEDIMRKLSRWYDVDVVYEGVDLKSSFYGSMSRYDHISKVLSKLELTGDIHFKIEGRTIRITK